MAGPVRFREGVQRVKGVQLCLVLEKDAGRGLGLSTQMCTPRRKHAQQVSKGSAAVQESG